MEEIEKTPKLAGSQAIAGEETSPPEPRRSGKKKNGGEKKRNHANAKTGRTQPPPQYNPAALRRNPEAVRHAFETGDFPYHTKMKRRVYEKQKWSLQTELLKAQKWIEESGQKVVVLFEGRDAAGKGGTIKRFTEHLNPRGARVVALNKPSDREKSQWFFQRYVAHLPSAGELVFFDRSWYNRAGVERVMGFCTPNEYLEFMRQAPDFERMLVRSGTWLFKYWFSVTQEEQRRRFKARKTDPLKLWKLLTSPHEVVRFHC